MRKQNLYATGHFVKPDILTSSGTKTIIGTEFNGVQKRQIMLKTENKNKDVQEASSLKINRDISHLGPSLTLKGDISGQEDFVFHGVFQGKINLENNNVTVAPGGKLNAEIRVKNITIRGSVQGNIHATGKVFIEKDGKMTGDISAARISIMEGAQFKGSIKMLTSLQPA